MLVPLAVAGLGSILAGLPSRNSSPATRGGVLPRVAEIRRPATRARRNASRPLAIALSADRDDGDRLVSSPGSSISAGRTCRSSSRAQQPLLYRFLLNKWYFDEIYDFLFVRPALRLGRLLWKGGDGFVIDGFGPDGVSARVIDVTRNVVRLQTGYLYHYAFAMLIGVAALHHLVHVRGDRTDVGWPILSVITFLPLVGALFILLHPRRGRSAQAQRALGRAVDDARHFRALADRWCGASIPASAEFQFVEKLPWLGGAINYHMGVDGISLPFVILTTALMPICIIASWTPIQTRVKEYMIAFLVLETLMIGTFCALDLVLFYLFFEGGLIPMFLIIGVWGGPRRVYASFKFFLYTLLGSVLMLLAIMAMYWDAGTTDIPTLLKHGFPRGMQTWLWLAFFASFAVKMPMWPVHTWLPDAHVEAPTAGSVILAAILLKMGGYGFLRFSLPMFPDASHDFAPLDLRAVGHRDHLHLAGRAGAGGHEEADRLFVRRPYGLRDDGHLRRDHAGHRRRHLPDDLAWHRFRRAVPLRRRRLRPHAYARDRRLWRAGEPHAALCRRLHAVHDGQCRLAGHVRLRRRVPGADRHLPGQYLGGDARDHRRDPVGLLCAVALPQGRSSARSTKPSLAGIADLDRREIIVFAPLVVLTISVRRLSEAGARHVGGVGRRS